MTNIELQQISNDTDMKLFWELFNTYIHELAEKATQGDGIDLEYFCSSEYSDAVERISRRDKNPIRIHFIMNEENIVGFSMYQILFDTQKNCCLMEYYIVDEYRHKGFGRIAYEKVEQAILDDGVETIELTPTNEVNKVFWEARGYVQTSELDEDNKFIYRKSVL